MMSWDLLTSICKEMLNRQISSTLVLKNSSAMLLLPPALIPATELLLLGFLPLIVSFLRSGPALAVFPTLPSLVCSPSFPSRLLSLPFQVSFPTSCLSCLPDPGVDRQTGQGPLPPTGYLKPQEADVIMICFFF